MRYRKLGARGFEQDCWLARSHFPSDPPAVPGRKISCTKSNSRLPTCSPLPRGVKVARMILDHFVKVRILARQPCCLKRLTSKAQDRKAECQGARVSPATTQLKGASSEGRTLQRGTSKSAIRNSGCSLFCPASFFGIRADPGIDCRNTFLLRPTTCFSLLMQCLPVAGPVR